MLNKLYEDKEVEGRYGKETKRTYFFGRIVGATAATLLATSLFFSSVYVVDGGEIAMEQAPSGKLIPRMDPGVKFKVPYVSKVDFYNQITTVTYDLQEKSATSANQPYDITFGDTYSGKIKGSFRIEMPTDPEKFIKLHKAFKRYDNFVDNGAEKFTNELLSYTAIQFTGENFMQGGQNEYKTRLLDQARGGLYKTKREQIKVSRQAGNVGLKDDKASKTTNSESIVFRNVVQRDKDGKILRSTNPMDVYGVKVSQVTVDGFIPEPALEQFMKNKKGRVQERAKLIEDQENERQKAITAKLTGDRERVEAKQQMLKEKDSAVIQAQKQVELEQKAAELQLVRKQKELDIALANEGIQKANEKAAKYEAMAIEHKGLAEANVLDAMYKAKDPQLYALEKQVEITSNLKGAMQGITIEMPKVQINGEGGSSGASNSIDVVMQAIGVQKLQEIAESVSNKK